MAFSAVGLHFSDGDGSRVFPATTLDRERIGVLATIGVGPELGLYGTADQLEDLARGILESIGRPVPPARATLDQVESELELDSALKSLQAVLRRLRGGDGPPNTETGSPVDDSDLITLTDEGEHALAGRPASLLDS